MTNDSKVEKSVDVDARYLMRLCVGGIVKTTNKEMEPEMLLAIAAQRHRDCILAGADIGSGRLIL